MYLQKIDLNKADISTQFFAFFSKLCCYVNKWGKQLFPIIEKSQRKFSR